MTIYLRVILVLLLATSPAWAVVTSDSAGSHATMPGQTAFGVNVDGVVTVAWESSDPNLGWFHSCTGALITDRQILSSAHCFDQNRDGKVDGGIPHVAAFDLAQGRVILPIALAETRFPSQWYESDEEADVAVLQLVDTAPAEVPRYPLYGGWDETSHPFVLVGYGNAGSGATGEEGPTWPYPLKQAGKNQYELALSEFLVYDFDSGEPAHNALELLGIPSNLGYGIDEVSAAPGDSGAPTFIEGAIAGVVARGLRRPEFDYTKFRDASWGEWGEDTRVSSYRTFLIEATNGLARWVHVAGDFDQDGRLMVGDVDLLSQQIRSGLYAPEYDFVRDSEVDLQDQTFWVKQLKKTYFGDANLDGEFDSHDFVQVLQAGKYETGWLDAWGNPQGELAGWAEGDWNADGVFDSADFVIGFQDGGYEQGPRTDAAAVPEPASSLLFVTGLVAVVVGRRFV